MVMLRGSLGAPLFDLLPFRKNFMWSPIVHGGWRELGYKILVCLMVWDILRLGVCCSCADVLG